MKSIILSKSKYLILVSNLIVIVFILAFSSCNGNESNSKKEDDDHRNKNNSEIKKIITGANQTEIYLPLLRNKKIAVVANQTSVIFKENGDYTHLIDSLISLEVNISKVFAPEHGFRGKADAGEHILDAVDQKTGLPLVSLHGKYRKPPSEVLKDVELVLFDIQDVGVRFYTYISTMSMVMEACAEMNIPVIILDRPNPNGHFVDGPMLEIEHKSFVGMHPIPLVYGLTIGEYAHMVNGEKWLKDSVQCNVTIIPLKNYTHQSKYNLPVRPSPNLPNDKSINLYPGLGFFEGTIINAGRGTEYQFQRYGAPFFAKSEFSYTPKPNFGSKHPKFEGELCYGVDLTSTPRLSQVDISALIDAYHKTPNDKDFFGKTFTVHAGNLKLQKQIEDGMTANEIRATWQVDIKAFKKVREKYLIYE